MKRVLSSFLILLMVFSMMLPTTAFAADMDTIMGYSDSVAEDTGETTPGVVATEDAPQSSPTEAPQETTGENNPESGVADDTQNGGPAETLPEDGAEENPGDTSGELPDGAEAATCEISPFSEFVGDGSEFFTKIRLIATDRQGNPLSGAVYGLYKINDEFVEYLTTDYSGVAVSNDVPVDTDYYLIEETPPTGYAPNTGRKDIILAEVCAPSRIDITVEYDPITGRIEVIKTDEYGNPLPGAGFYVYNESTGQHVDTLLTDENGRAVTIDLPYGQYELYEYLVPEGHDGGGYYMAMIEYEGQTVTVYVTNYQSRAYVRVYKTGEDERVIQGVVFSVYRAGTDEWIEDITTNSGGYAYSSGLVLGDYYLIEKSVPEGYRLDAAPHYFTLSYSWQTVYIDLVNERAGEPGKLKIIKTDENENPLSGVVFGLYRAWDNKKLAELTTGADGTVESGLLIPQDYYLVELVGKDGYESNTGQITFTVGQSGTTVVVVVVNPKTRVFGKVKAIKQDDAGNPLPGVRFGLYCGKGNLLQEMITGADGTATSGVLNAGDYYLVELSGIPGYTSDTQQHPVSITENNVTVPITIINPRITGSVKVIKTGEDNEPLPGVVFGIFKDGVQLHTLTTGGDGTAVSGALYYGAYELRELSTIPGYELLDVSIPFSVLADGAVIEIPVTNPLIYGGVSILKTDGGENQPVAEMSAVMAANPLSGAVFGVYNGQGQLIAELTTDTDGKAGINGLVMGDYFLREHVAPEGFAPIEYDIPFSITAQGEVIEITVPNIAGSGVIRVIKTGEGGGRLPNDAPLTGVVFEVYRASDNELVTEITTDENGVAEVELPLAAYYLLETQTVEGYRLPEGSFSFALTEHGVTVELPIQNQKEPPAEPDPGAIKIIKTDEDGNTLSGAVFGLYAAATGEQLAELTTGENGEAVYELPAAAVYLIEKTAPLGFVLDDSRIDAVIRSGEVTEITVINKPVPPVEPDPGAVKVIKKAEGSGALLPGAVFALHDADSGLLLATLTTGADGTAQYELPEGRFYLLEQKAPEGFQLISGHIGFEVKAGETTELTVINKPVPPAPPTTGKIQLIKKAEGTGALLSGAVFGLYDAGTDIKIAELTTDKNGEALTGELPSGAYYLLEKTAPTGFTLSTEKTGVTVKAGETVTVIVTNTPIPAEPTPAPGTVKVIKKAEDTGKRLSGAVFTIYRASDDKKVAEITTGKDGAASYELEAARYYLVEKTAPEGFKLNTDKISYTVKSGETKEITVTNAPKDANEPDTGSLYLVKKAEGTGARLPGAVFGVYRTSDNKKLIEITTDSDGEAVCDLEPGSFYLRELKAPASFVLENVSIPFTIKADSTVRVEVTNMRQQANGSVKLVKRGPDGEAVSGAVFGIYKASDNVKVTEITSGADGTALHEFAPGAYYLLESSVSAPYIKSSDKHSFTVKSGQTVEVRVVNQRTAPAPNPTPPGVEEIPKTGEAFPYGSYALAALFMALALLCGVTLYRERGRKATANQ